MSQEWSDNVYQGNHVGQTDLQHIEDNFAALKSCFSGSSTPPNPVNGMQYYDTGSNCHKVYRNGSWVSVLTGASGNTFKLWLYQNSAEDGWVVDSGVSDVIIAIKGGSQAYNVSGGNTAGTWTQPNHTHTLSGHTHDIPNHKHDLDSSTDSDWWDTAGYTTHVVGGAVTVVKGGTYAHANILQDHTKTDGSGTTTSPSPNSTGSGAPADTYRPSAAVCTLQRPDI